MLRTRKQSMQSMDAQRYSGLLEWIKSQMAKEGGYNLSDRHCICYLNENIIVKQHIITLEMLVTPLRGIFANVQFRPRIYLNQLDTVASPRVVNDRPAFHPNIDVSSCEIAIEELHNQWNPTRPYSICRCRLILLLRSVKYVLIEPNPRLVPNKPWNKKAAWYYCFSRDKYSQMLHKYSSQYLSERILNEDGQKHSQNTYLNIESLLRRERISAVKQSQDNQKQCKMLCKNIRKLTFSVSERIPKIV